jgi:hypothetical protein
VPDHPALTEPRRGAIGIEPACGMTRRRQKRASVMDMIEQPRRLDPTAPEEHPEGGHIRWFRVSCDEPALKQFGFRLARGGVHLFRTMMLAELTALFIATATSGSADVQTLVLASNTLRQTDRRGSTSRARPPQRALRRPDALPGHGRAGEVVAAAGGGAPPACFAMRFGPRAVVARLGGRGATRPSRHTIACAGD